MVQQDRNIMALVYVLAHARSLRRKQRGIYPLVIQRGDRRQTLRRPVECMGVGWGPAATVAPGEGRDH